MHRLYKSEKDKVFDGVCGGIGEYLNIDPVIVRLLWVLLVIFGGTGVVAYLVAMLIIPKKGQAAEDEIVEEKAVSVNVSHRFWGILLIVAGLFLLMGFIGPIGGLFVGLTAIMGHALWPLLVIGLGLYLLFNQSEKGDIKSTIKEAFPSDRKIHRSRTDRKLSGVCGGIGAYFQIDSNIIRIFWIMATLGSFGFGILVYAALALYLTDSDV